MKLFLDLFHPVIDNVTEMSDLLSFALSCKTLAAIILPKHLFYHTIYGSGDQTKLWIYLILNPNVCQYIRRLNVSYLEIDSPKMRLTRFDVGVGRKPYEKPNDLSALLWKYELIGRALSQMINLKAFVWSLPETPIFDTKSKIAREFSSSRLLKQVPNISLRQRLNLDIPEDRHYISIFDTPITHPICGLISLTINCDGDRFDSGKSLVKFVAMCRHLESFRLSIDDQEFIGDFVSSARWRNLRNLSLDIVQHHGTEPSEESIRDFISFHSNIVSLNWHVSFFNRDFTKRTQLRVTSLPSGCLPNLLALNADSSLVQTLIATPCNPSRRLAKITDLPAHVKLWEDPETTFRGIDKASLKIVSLSGVKSLLQLGELTILFPNIEVLNFPVGLKIFPRHWERSRMSYLPDLFRTLSCLRSLRVVLGFQFWEIDWDDEEEDRNDVANRDQNNNAIFHRIKATFPQFDFCASEDIGVAFVRRDGIVVDYTWVPGDALCSARERDLTIPEEWEQFAL